MRHLLAVVTLAVAVPASAQIDILTSRSTFQTASLLSFLGDEDRNGLETDWSWIHAGQNGGVHSGVLSQDVSVAHGNASVKAQGTHTLTSTADEFTLTYQGGSSFGMEWDAPAGTPTEADLFAVAANTTEFVLTEHARIEVNAVVEFERDAPRESNFFPQARIFLLDQQNASIFDYFDILGDIHHDAVLSPGEYTVIVTSLAVHGSFNTAEDGAFFAYSTADIDAQISVTTIPAPTAALLFPLLAATARRRR